MRKLDKFFAIVSFVVLASSCLLSQSPSVTAEPKWYSSVPETERQAFLSRFERAIILRKQSAWSDLYDMRYNQDNETKQEYVTTRSQWRALIWFHPKRAFYVPPEDSWNIQGCARYRDPSGKEYLAPSVMHAYLVSQQWLFNDLAVIVGKSSDLGCGN
jgi:hypothetical protein